MPNGEFVLISSNGTKFHFDAMPGERERIYGFAEGRAVGVERFELAGDGLENPVMLRFDYLLRPGNVQRIAPLEDGAGRIEQLRALGAVDKFLKTVVRLEYRGAGVAVNAARILQQAPIEDGYRIQLGIRVARPYLKADYNTGDWGAFSWGSLDWGAGFKAGDEFPI